MAKVVKRRGSPKWQAEVWSIIGGRRKRFWKSTGIVDDGTAKSQQTALVVAREIERSFAVEGEGRLRRRSTLLQALEALTEAAEVAGRSRHTLDNIMYRGKRLIDFFGRDKLLADIELADLVKYAAWSRAKRRKYTVHREFVVLYSAYGAVEEKRPKFPDLGDYKDHKKQRLLQTDEQRRFLMVVPPERRLNVMAYLRCGLRLSEPWKVVWVDWVKQRIGVQGTKRRKDAKDGPRTVPVPDDCFELMLERRLQRPEPIPATGREVVTAENPVFPPWHRQPVDFVIRRSSERALGEAISANDLRGTWITNMARHGEHQLSLAKMAGNSVKMLDEVYAQLDKMDDAVNETAAKLPRLTAAKSVKSKLSTNEGEVS